MLDTKRRSKDEMERSVMAILLDDEVKIGKPNSDVRKTLDIDLLVPYADHPFKLYEGERLDDMVRSVKELGVIVPIIVRPYNEDEETYEILSGHNRVNAAKIAGLTEVPVIIKNGLTDDDAELIVTETNLVQRSFADLTHSQRAIALKRHMDAISKQGKRNDLLIEIERLSNPDEIKENATCDPLEHKLKSREQAAKTYDLSPSNVARYLRVAELINPLINRVDADEIAIRAAVSLSYLSPDEQTGLNRLLDEASYKIDMKKAEALRCYSESKKLTNEKMIQILSGELDKKPKPKSPPPLKIKHKIYSKYFSADTKQSEMEVIIDQALAEYFANHGNKEESPADEERRTA